MVHRYSLWKLLLYSSNIGVGDIRDSFPQSNYWGPSPLFHKNRRPWQQQLTSLCYIIWLQNICRAQRECSAAAVSVISN